MNAVILHCPQCGHDSSGIPDHARACPACRTLLIHVAGMTRSAVRYGGSALPAEKQTVAIVCCTCGGALPEEILQQKASLATRCAYCGSNALLPDVLGLLRLAVTRPRLLPVHVRRFFLAWGALLLMFLGTCALHVLQDSPALDVEQFIVLQQGEPATEVNGARRHVLNARGSSITVKPRGNSFLNAIVSADRLKDTHLRLKVTAVREETRERREMWITLWDGATSGGGEALSPASHPYAEPSLGANYSPATWPPGRYHLVIEEAEVRGGELPAMLSVTWSSWHSPGHGWYILAANVLLWTFLLTLMKVGRDPLSPGPVWNRGLLAALAVCVGLLVNEVAPVPGLYAKGTFAAQAAGR